MLDANLLAFYIADAKDGTKHHSTFYQTRAGSEPEPAYTLRHADPESPNSRNCYAVALFDSYIEDVLFGEVLLHPKWTHPTLSQDEIRRNGGVPPPPEPIMPTEFTIQLYNPDQQIQVTQKSSALLGTVKWEFSMPQDTFRAPSTSMLDKSQNDPGAASTTPKLNFVWKRDNKFSKEMSCYMTGKSTDVQGRKKSKEPDITIALLKGLKEMTIYEPNLYRVEMEDPKGLEVVLLLSAAVIRDVFFGNLKQAFNISNPDRRGSGGSASTSPTLEPISQRMNPMGSSAATNALYPGPNAKPSPNDPNASQKPTLGQAGTMPITDPRTQWEINAETARLKAQSEAEEREQSRRNELQRKEREKADAEEARRLKRIFDQEEKDRKAKQKQIDKETERLKRLYGKQGSPTPAQPPPQLPPRDQQQLPSLPPRQHSPNGFASSMSNATAFAPGFTPAVPQSYPPVPQSAPPFHQQPYAPPPPINFFSNPPPQPNYYPPPMPMQLPAPQGHFSYNPSPGPQPGLPPGPGPNYLSTPPPNQQPTPSHRRSFFNLRGLTNDDDSNRLMKKTSSVW